MTAEELLSKTTGIPVEDIQFKHEVQIIRPSEAIEALDILEQSHKAEVKKQESLYLSAVKGRKEFRQALKEAREKIKSHKAKFNGFVELLIVANCPNKGCLKGVIQCGLDELERCEWCFKRDRFLEQMGIKTP